jgi:ABC-2 type transport system ATP-binding protein
LSDRELVVEAEHLTRRFGSFIAVDDVNLRVPRGSIFGFLGPSGCGKTTTIRILCGLLKPTSGRAVVNGYDIERDPETLRQNIGYMSQKFALYHDMTVRENMQFYGGIYGMPGKRLAMRMDEVLTLVDLPNREEMLTASLPLGWKQRIALATAMLHEPPVLFLDEPTSGVDPASRRLFWEILDELAGSGTSIFVTTHAMDEVDRCDMVAIMYRGRLVAVNDPVGLKKEFEGELYHVEGEPLLQALETARKLPGVEDAALFGSALHITADGQSPEGLRRSLEAAGVRVGAVRPIAATMEDVFVQAITRSERELVKAGREGAL